MNTLTTGVEKIFIDRYKLLKNNAKAIMLIDNRAKDVLKPLFNFDGAEVVKFQQENMCLLTNQATNKFQLNSQIFSDIENSLGNKAKADLGISWFWMHQMVHIEQGLSYESFRSLNKDTDRSETMRADCWADFISIKCLAISELLKIGYTNITSKDIFDKTTSILSEIVIPMISMRPNIFIPFRRDIEIKRILSLYTYHIINEKISKSDINFRINDSLFCNWRRDFSNFYIWYGNTSLLSGKTIRINMEALDNIILKIRYGDHSEAYEMLALFDLPTASELELHYSENWITL